VSAHLVWEGEGTATLVTLDRDRVELVSSRAFAPGSRPRAHLEAEQGGDRKNAPIWMKVHGARRQDDGLYRVTGRLLNATRELRALLEEAILKGPDRC
jgi:hypothetical protein